MAHNPHAPQGPDPSQDPAGSTQMFRAFVDEEGGSGPGAQRGAAPQASSSGPRVGLIVGVVAVIAVVAAAVWLAMG
jgi:hypothetical protein